MLEDSKLCNITGSSCLMAGCSTSDDVNKFGEHSCVVNQQWGTLITLWNNRP
jgi:hypothetical protein